MSSTLDPEARSIDEPAEAAEGRLPRRLGSWSTMAVTIGIMIGSGIFRVPAAAAAQTGSAEVMLAAWVLGGIVALCGALSLAEVAALYPKAGGIYVYLREAYGSLTAFLFGWLYLVIIPTGAGAIALVFAEYLGRLVPLTPDEIRGVATVVIVLLATAQYRSVRFGAAIQNASTIAKVSAPSSCDVRVEPQPAANAAAARGGISQSRFILSSLE